MLHAAFLRGINVGRRRVTGADLEAAFESVGCVSPSSYQAAGNIVFEDPRDQTDLVGILESGLEDRLGFEVRVLLRSDEQLATLAIAAPFSADELDGAGKVQAVLVANEPDAPAAEAALALAPAGEVLRWEPGVLWWLPAAGLSDSEIDLDALNRCIGLNTIRTKGTLERMARKYLPAG